MKNVCECGSECKREREGKNSKNGVFGLKLVAVVVVAVSVIGQFSSNGRTGILSMVISWKFAQGPGA